MQTEKIKILKKIKYQINANYLDCIFQRYTIKEN